MQPNNVYVKLETAVVRQKNEKYAEITSQNIELHRAHCNVLALSEPRKRMEGELYSSDSCQKFYEAHAEIVALKFQFYSPPQILC